MASVTLVVLPMLALFAVVWPWQAQALNAWGWIPIAVAFVVKGWTEYGDYAARTPRLIPRLVPRRPS